MKKLLINLIYFLKFESKSFTPFLFFEYNGEKYNKERGDCMNKVYPDFFALLRRRPSAYSYLHGSARWPDINGTVRFYETKYGVVVAAQITGLPSSNEPCKSPIFGFHIHEGGACSGTEEAPFSAAMGHYNPHSCPHPYHAGDMPPIFGAEGRAFLAFLSSRFSVKEIVGKTVIIHAGPDDFKTQPSGNAGSMIACGVIKASGF